MFFPQWTGTMLNNNTADMWELRTLTATLSTHDDLFVAVVL